jgi:hypothetical protein
MSQLLDWLAIDPIHDETLNEDVSWRIEAMNSVWGFLPNQFGALPKFYFARYKQPRADWDHDHCAGCGVKIMEVPYASGILTEGYCDNVDPFEADDWLCADCHRILMDIVTGKKIASVKSP